MSDTNTSARPRQLTMAGCFVVGGSLLLLVSVFDSVANLNSVDTRDEVAQVLSAGGAGFDLSVGQALTVMRAGLTVAGVCAAAAAVLGVFVLQRSTGARLALTIVAVPILLTAPLTGGLMGALVAASTAVLWSGPARDWFAGRPVRQPVAPAKSPPPPPVAGPADPPAPVAPEITARADPSTQPPATRGFGETPVDPRSVQPGAPVWAATRTNQPWAATAAAGPVPVPVKVACFATWVFSGAVALMYAVLLVALVVARGDVVDLVKKSPAWEQGNLQEDMLLPVLWVGCLMFLGWSLGACVLAVFTWRRQNWARYLLVASAGAALVASTFAFPVGIAHQIAAAATIGTLFSAAARAWFAAPAGGPPPPSPPGAGPGGWPPPAPQDPSPPEYPEGKPRVWWRGAGFPGRPGIPDVIGQSIALERQGTPDNPADVSLTFPDEYVAARGQACRSVARRRLMPSSIRSGSLQNAHRMRCRPSAEPSS